MASRVQATNMMETIRLKYGHVMGKLKFSTAFTILFVLIAVMAAPGISVL